jgi:hypothetical protein
MTRAFEAVIETHPLDNGLNFFEKTDIENEISS